jgi:hypothetical protein
MQDLYIDETKHTPLIELNATNKTLDFKGNSYPEDTFEYFKPILDWIEELSNTVDEKDKITVSFELNYMNSSSFKVLYNICDLLAKSVDNGASLEVSWIYDEENDVIEEIGEDLKDDFGSLNIELKPVKVE